MHKKLERGTTLFQTAAQVRDKHAALHSSPKSRGPVKFYVQLGLAVQELRGAEVLVTPMGGLGASTFLMLSRQHDTEFFILFCSPKDGFFALCYAMPFISYRFRYSLENVPKFLFFGTTYLSERRFDEIFS